MDQPSALELRIYSGNHAGARVPLEHGRYKLGADESCDFILSDPGVAPQHAELQFSPEARMLFPLSPDSAIPPEGLPLEDGYGVEIGPLILAIEPVEAPWQKPDWILLPALPCEIDESETLVAPLAEPEELPPTVAPMTGNRRYGLYLWPALAGVAILVAVLVALAWPQTPEPAAVAPAIVPDSKEPVLAAIDKLGFKDSARVDHRANGKVIVQALLNDEDYEKLAIALSQLNPRPELKVTLEQELVRSVREVLAMHGGKLSAEYLGAGKFRIDGLVAGDAERDTLIRALTAEFPAARGFESAAMTRDALLEKVVAELRDKKAADIQGQWRDEDLLVTAKIPWTDLRAWEQWLTGADDRYGKWVRFALTADAERRELPLKIKSIISGITSFVVLADERKILPGGSVDGWQLVEINADSVVFDGPRRVVVKR